MDDPLYLPIVDGEEVRNLLKELPLAVDPERFAQFVLGFPRHYLVRTPRVDIIRHFLLMESRGKHPLATSLSREGSSWKLCLIADDRDLLFSRIAGSLSCVGMDIRSAEAFANANSIVLDTFEFTDPENAFSSGRRQQEFLELLDNAVAGQGHLEELFEARAGRLCILDDQPPSIRMDNSLHPDATYLSIDFPDHFGHLYLTSRCIAEQGGNIEMAYVHISGSRIHDEFYLTRKGEKLNPRHQQQLKEALERVMLPYQRPKPVLAEEAV